MGQPIGGIPCYAYHNEEPNPDEKAGSGSGDDAEACGRAYFPRLGPQPSASFYTEGWRSAGSSFEKESGSRSSRWTAVTSGLAYGGQRDRALWG